MQIRNLINLLGDSEAEFRHAFANKVRWHRPGRIDSAAAAELFPPLIVDRLLAGGRFPLHQLRVLINGAEAMQSLYVDEQGLRQDALQSFLRQGATLSLNDVGSVIPAIGELAAAMERALGVRCGVNAYLATGGKAAFRPHHDGHDVLVLQCQGAKRWYSHGEPFAYPLTGVQVANAPPPVWDTVMMPGDLLFLPRGEVHSTLPEETPSVHLTFGFSEMTGVDFLSWITKQAGDDPVLRRDLGATLAPGQREDREAAVKLALHALIDEMLVETFMDDQRAERSVLPMMNIAPERALDQKCVLTSALRRQVNLMPEVAGELRVRIGGKYYNLSQLSRQLLAQVTSRDRVTVAELATCAGCMTDDTAFVAALSALLQVALVGATN